MAGPKESTGADSDELLDKVRKKLKELSSRERERIVQTLVVLYGIALAPQIEKDDREFKKSESDNPATPSEGELTEACLKCLKQSFGILAEGDNRQRTRVIRALATWYEITIYRQERFLKAAAFPERSDHHPSAITRPTGKQTEESGKSSEELDIDNIPEAPSSVVESSLEQDVQDEDDSDPFGGMESEANSAPDNDDPFSI